jgi:hypothetical protein
MKVGMLHLSRLGVMVVLGIAVVGAGIYFAVKK